MKNSPRKRILAISIFFASILLSSCNSSIKSESNPTNNNSNKNNINFSPASREDMNLYRQIGISYFCLARQAEVQFSKSISIASNNFALLVSKKHGGLIEEIGDKKLTNEQIYQGSYLQVIEGAIQLCPDQVPEEDKEKFLEAVEKLNQNN
ncbi:Villin headpiece domain-containing protein [Prochlorococcus marinus]|uniref:Villin headpiece domain-containing protein n=1 Tax=Prochlorococcus marinus XMU1408 TaxID=2213228 RepID=A0A318R012_PROMR|nr:Villin headpiece domain-containing protein [Prochlorococcus marinus]MBW3042279.1 Villin headpiece domain-containing protein [Prochlorococcus marinus str. XMU1408]PYE01667.1 Villin headpiece domain-containing protein [Prochlorococcus marinus XMU1408]